MRSTSLSPYLSPTGYRSFLGLHGEPAPGLQPDEFCRRVIEAYVERELTGKLVPIRGDRATRSADNRLKGKIR